MDTSPRPNLIVRNTDKFTARRAEVVSLKYIHKDFEATRIRIVTTTNDIAQKSLETVR